MPITAAQLTHLADTFDYDKWNTKLKAAITDHYTPIAIDQAERAAAAYDLDEFDADDPFVTRFFTRYLGERITQIDETTRELVRNTVQRALEDGQGEGATELAGRIREAVGSAGAFSPSRALTIARTESGYAAGHGAGLLFRQNGIERVEISDGDDDDECAEADGQIWTVDEYLANALAHPNCVRSASPVVETDDDEDAEE